jgi:hypothetical protein
VDGRSLSPEVVICATGYHPGLEAPVGHLGAIDQRGTPTFQGADSNRELPGLWFRGMQPALPGYFYAARKDAGKLTKRIAEALAKRDRCA